MEAQRYPSQQAPRFMLRFDDPGHRGRLKAQADRAKRSLTKHLLLLVEEGEKALGLKGEAA